MEGLKNFKPLRLLPKNAQPPIHPQRETSVPVEGGGTEVLVFVDHKNHKRLFLASCSRRKLKCTYVCVIKIDLAYFSFLIYSHSTFNLHSVYLLMLYDM